VSSPEDQLRESFQAHENLAPDAAAVYARVQELSRSYKWRRRGMTAAGGVVVGAGLIAGIVNLPAVLPGDPAAHPAGPAAVAPAVQPPVTAPPLNPVDNQRAVEAFLQAGYNAADAMRLAALWHVSGDISQVKAEAGRRLLAGQKLPIPTPSATGHATEMQREARRQAYFDAGYDLTAAQKLAKLWKISDLSDVKAEAGRRLLAGEKLPVKPDPARTVKDVDSRRVAEFFAAGYDTDDAQTLAKLWKKPTAFDAKIEGGKRLLAGQTLPIKP
jgi:hypothetical protein